MTRTLAPRRLFLLVLAAALLLQTAWILAMPAFRGIDEFDHVYKAESVAHGQLLDDGAPANGRGGLLRVPEDVVAAASAMCSSYDYTGPDNCHPVENVGADLVTVASGAATYNPTYYAVVGLVALPFEGAASDFAMRAATAVLAALLLAWAAVVTCGWARNTWPLAALLVSATPVLIYSSTIASPNGVGYAAACLLWAAALGLAEDPRRPRLVAITLAALVITATHTTGVMWLACIVAVVGMVRPWRHWRSLLGAFPRGFAVAAAAVGTGAAACVAWILLAGTNAISSSVAFTEPLTFRDLATSELLWSLQTIAAFPLRDEPAPALVYLLWLVPFVALMVTGIRRASSRLRLAGGVLLLVWIAVPLLLSYLSYAAEGLAWQGRYALPLAIGFPALAGLALHRSSLAAPSRRTLALAVGLCAVAQTLSVVRVAWVESSKGLSASFVAEVPGAMVLITALALAGSLLPLLLLLRSRSTPTVAPAPATATAGAPT